MLYYVKILCEPMCQNSKNTEAFYFVSNLDIQPLRGW